MCIFTGPIERVEGTQIFVRRIDDGRGARQILAYAMRVSANAELAMVLPLPVPAGSPEDAVSFIDVSGMPDLFDQLGQLFAPSVQSFSLDLGEAEASLAVVEVGSFVASFVPSVADFSRRDARFQLSSDVWAALPRYADYGFAVFQLAAGNKDIHPMALNFPTREPTGTYFPCVHVHDGVVHESAEFDHVLYWQSNGDKTAPKGGGMWEPSLWPPREETVASSAGVLGPLPVFRATIEGDHPNRDVIA